MPREHDNRLTISWQDSFVDIKKLICVGIISSLAQAQSSITLTGAGASFPVPLYSRMFAEYEKLRGVRVNYQSVGSGAGQRQILAQTVDFGGSDAPMTNEMLAQAPGKNQILHIPMALGAVVPTYNLPSISARVQFDGPSLAGIYLGQITRWNDPALQKLNPNLNLPNLPITPVYRSDGSGTTSIWVDFLAKASKVWATLVSTGPQTSVKWPTGTGAPQNAGVAGLVRQTPGAIGYVEVAYARQNKLNYGLVRNSSGRFIDGGDLKAVSAAASGAPLPADTRVSLTNTAAANGYPISGFTWILVYRDQKYGNRSEAQAKALVELLRWMTSDGQKFNELLDYGTLPDIAVTRAAALIKSMKYGTKAL